MESDLEKFKREAAEAYEENKRLYPLRRKLYSLTNFNLSTHPDTIRARTARVIWIIRDRFGIDITARITDDELAYILSNWTQIEEGYHSLDESEIYEKKE